MGPAAAQQSAPFAAAALGQTAVTPADSQRRDDLDRLQKRIATLQARRLTHDIGAD
jgi:hypothetical protein